MNELTFGGVEETVYGNVKRLQWLHQRLDPGERVVEFGCGTGSMITLPLLRMGHDVRGVDLDTSSIEFGRSLLVDEGLDPDRLVASNVRDLPRSDAIIASEVLEHLASSTLSDVLCLLRERLHPRGRLFITVPNGYGWFEAETFLWHRCHVGALMETAQIDRAIRGLRRLFVPPPKEYPPSTLADSPHVQRFTLSNITQTLKAHGFEVLESRGSVLFAGQFTNMVFEGVRPFLRVNRWLGDRFPRAASGFFLLAKKQ